MQTSGEYWALASSAYARAKLALEAGLKDKSRTAATEQVGDYRNLPPAVIFDLDETVLDTSPFQGQLVIDRTDYVQDAWSEWVKSHKAAAIPGAVDFIQYALKAKVTPLFVTNRTAEEETATVENLESLGVPATTDNVLSNGENGWTSDKKSRREYVAKSYRIVLLVGDDLNDFMSVAGLTPEERLDAAKKYATYWTDRWILLPNGIYGGWERSLYPSNLTDAEILAKKRTEVQGFKTALKKAARRSPDR